MLAGWARFAIVLFRRKLRPNSQWCGSNQPVSEHGSSGLPMKALVTLVWSTTIPRSRLEECKVFCPEAGPEWCLFNATNSPVP